MIKTPYLAETLKPITKKFQGIDYALAGGAAVDAINHNTPNLISRDYDFFFSSHDEYLKAALICIKDPKMMLECETKNATSWGVNNLRIQLVIPTENKTIPETIQDFDLCNSMVVSYPPFDETINLSPSVESRKSKDIRINLDYMGFGLVSRILKYKFKGFDETPVVPELFAFFLSFNDKTLYPDAYKKSGYEDGTVPEEMRNATAWNAIASMLNHSVPFQEYCRKKEQEGILLPLHKMADYRLDELSKTVYRYHGYLKIQHNDIINRRRVFSKPKLNNEEEILKFMAEKYPEMLL